MPKEWKKDKKQTNKAKQNKQYATHILCNTVTHLQNIYPPSAIPAAWFHFNQNKHFYGNLTSLATTECTLVFMQSVQYFCTISTAFESSGQSSMKVTNYQISRIILPVVAMQIHADLGTDWHLIEDIPMC